MKCLAKSTSAAFLFSRQINYPLNRLFSFVQYPLSVADFLVVWWGSQPPHRLLFFFSSMHLQAFET